MSDLNHNDPNTWLHTVWNALDCHRENSIPCHHHEDEGEGHEEEFDREWEKRWKKLVSKSRSKANA